ncbi:MAG: DUF3298 domain-containing protein [Prevotella sp.]|nr:DUF3298 domain-containing protein [Prevotella sp.]
MKRNIMVWIAALAIAACGNEGQRTVTKAGSIDLDSITVDTTVALTDDADAPKAHIHLSMVYGKGDESKALNKTIVHAALIAPDYMGMLSDDVTVRQAVDSFVINYISDYLRDYAPLYRGDREHRQSYESEFTCHCTVENNRDGIVSYIAHSNTYGGGEHSVSSTIVKNIELKTGKILTLEDIFVPGYEQPLKDLIVEELCHRQDASSLTDLQEKGFFSGIEPYATDNFVLGDGEIRFVYVDSEIAPHETGEITVVLDDSKIKQLMK